MGDGNKAGIGIFGAAGRMGRVIADEIAARGLVFVGGIDKSGSTLEDGRVVGNDPFGLASKSDVIIDFSSPAALPSNLNACIAAGKAILIGTTGLEAEHHALIDAAAKQIAVLQTGNTSLGVNLIAALVRDAASRLGPDWDIEIVEMHHRHKVDAPSGTALLLGEAAAAGRNIRLADHSERGRDGVTGARAEGSIGFASLRGGSVAGDHQVIFATDQERIEIGHRAENRTIFARGAVTGALWLAGQKPGRYAMPDVLGL
jgi:4-hydroxy-tetrahydrodipicolinate reductase